MNLKIKDLFKGNFVKLSATRPTDVEEMAKWQEDGDYLRRMDTDFSIPQSVDTLREHERARVQGSSSIEFKLRSLEDDRLIGFVALFGIEWNNRAGKLAIGIGEPNNRGKGYGTDALRLILRYAFYELNLNRVGLDVISYNHSAIEAYKKVGFKEEGRMRSAVLRDGQQFDRIMMSILRDEWAEMEKNSTYWR